MNDPFQSLSVSGYQEIQRRLSYTNVYLMAHSRLYLADQARRIWKTGYALGTAETIWFELLT